MFRAGSSKMKGLGEAMREREERFWRGSRKQAGWDQANKGLESTRWTVDLSYGQWKARERHGLFFFVEESLWLSCGRKGSGGVVVRRETCHSLGERGLGSRERDMPTPRMHNSRGEEEIERKRVSEGRSLLAQRRERYPPGSHSQPVEAPALGATPLVLFT